MSAKVKSKLAPRHGVWSPGISAVIVSILGVVAFAQILVTLFGKDIPGVMISFFKGAEEFVMLAAIFVFVLAWMKRAQPRRRNGPYTLAAFDVFGQETQIDGIRTSFRSRDVALSFAKQYRKAYPMHNFAVLTDGGEARRTIVRYV